MKEEITGIILSGGKSSRLGQEKGLADFNGKPLIQYAIDVLKPISDKIIISANNQLDEYTSFGYEVVQDQVRGIGPLGGIIASLKKSVTRYNFVLSCDTPFVPAELFSYLLNSIENFQVAVPKHGEKLFEPLCAVYATNVIWDMQHCIETQNYRLHHFLKESNARFVPIHNKLPFYHEEMFVNMNTQKDIQKNSND